MHVSAADVASVHSGWLYRQGDTILTWKRRWVVLSTDCALYVFRSPEDKECLARVPLVGTSLETLIESPSISQEYAFRLSMFQTAPALFAAETDAELNQWTRFITASTQLGQGAAEGRGSIAIPKQPATKPTTPAPKRMLLLRLGDVKIDFNIYILECSGRQTIAPWTACSSGTFSSCLLFYDFLSHSFSFFFFVYQCRIRVFLGRRVPAPTICLAFIGTPIAATARGAIVVVVFVVIITAKGRCQICMCRLARGRTLLCRRRDALFCECQRRRERVARRAQRERQAGPRPGQLPIPRVNYSHQLIR